MIEPPFPVACMCGKVQNAVAIRSMTCRCDRIISRDTVDAAFEVAQMRWRKSLVLSQYAKGRRLADRVFGARAPA